MSKQVVEAIVTTAVIKESLELKHIKLISCL